MANNLSKTANKTTIILQLRKIKERQKYRSIRSQVEIRSGVSQAQRHPSTANDKTSLLHSLFIPTGNDVVNKL